MWSELSCICGIIEEVMKRKNQLFFERIIFIVHSSSKHIIVLFICITILLSIMILLFNKLLKKKGRVIYLFNFAKYDTIENGTDTHISKFISYRPANNNLII